LLSNVTPVSISNTESREIEEMIDRAELGAPKVEKDKGKEGTSLQPAEGKALKWPNTQWMDAR